MDKQLSGLSGVCALTDGHWLRVGKAIGGDAKRGFSRTGFKST